MVCRITECSAPQYGVLSRVEARHQYMLVSDVHSTQYGLNRALPPVNCTQEPFHKTAVYARFKLLYIYNSIDCLQLSNSVNIIERQAILKQLDRVPYQRYKNCIYEKGRVFVRFRSTRLNVGNSFLKNVSAFFHVFLLDQAIF